MVAEDFAIEVHGYSSYSVAKSLRQLLKLLALTFYEIKEMHLNCPLQLLKEVFKQKQQQQQKIISSGLVERRERCQSGE